MKAAASLLSLVALLAPSNATKKIRLLTAFALFAPLVALPAADNPQVPRWQPHDFSFPAQSSPPNPFYVDFSATVTGPDGKTFTMPGFFDGNGIWKIRVSPTSEGQWSLVTQSELPELNGKTATFTGVKNLNPKINGVLRVDPAHPHHFIFADGTRFFMQGYEYDWLWALDQDKTSVPTIEKSLDMLSGHGFNYVIVNSYAHDTSWRKGKTAPDDYGPSLLYPWAGNNEAPDHSRLNLAYWNHYDRMMNALLARGIQDHMLIKVNNKQVKWPTRRSAEEKLFFRWLIARYAAYPNLIWDFCKEAHGEKDLAYKQEWLKYIRATDPYHHLVTVHDDDTANDNGAYDDLTDFRADQHHGMQQGRNQHDMILWQRERRAWPVANVESDYECGPGGLKDKTFSGAHTPEQTAQTLWAIAMAGGYTAYYYTYTAWDVIRPLEVTPGYGFMKHFGNFWRSTDYWRLQPSDKLVSAGWCLADKGKEYVAWQKEPAPFTLEITGAASPLPADWFNPFTGKRTAAGSFGNGTAKLDPPSDWGSAPLVLHIRAK